MAKNEVISVNFKDVPESGSLRIPAGDYIAKVKKVEKKTSQSSDKPYLMWSLEIVSGGDKSAKGKVINTVTSLQPQALFNLRNFLVAIGIDVPAKALKLDLGKLIGKIIGITVEDDEYRGDDNRKVKKSAVVEVFPVKQGKGGKYEKMAMPDEDDYDDEEEEEEEEDEDEDEEEEDEDDEEEDEDEDEEEEDEEEEDEDEDEDEDDEDEEEEEVKPKKGKKSPPAKKSRPVKSSKPAPKGKAKKGRK